MKEYIKQGIGFSIGVMVSCFVLSALKIISIEFYPPKTEEKTTTEENEQ